MPCISKVLSTSLNRGEGHRYVWVEMIIVLGLVKAILLGAKSWFELSEFSLRLYCYPAVSKSFSLFVHEGAG